MPNHIYIARHEPPSAGDRIRAHSDAFVVSGYGIVVGLLIVAGGLSPSFDPSPSLAELPDWLNLIIGALMTGGSAARMWPILRTYETQDDYWLAHRLATAGQALGWSSYGLAAFWLRTYSIVPWLMAAGMATMAGWAFIESFLDEHRVREERARQLAKQEGPPNER